MLEVRNEPEMVSKKITRTYTLQLSPNPAKEDAARYCYNEHLRMVNLWTGKLFFNGNKPISTAGLGQLANQAQHRARAIVKAQTAAARETGMKTNVPVVRFIGCPAKVDPAKQTLFDYWVSVPNLWTKTKQVLLPAQSHKALNKKLCKGWKLNRSCEFFLSRKGNPMVRVFVQREVEKATLPKRMLGCDVGYRNSVSRSDGYIGRNMSKTIKRSRERRAEQQRQGHPCAVKKTSIKQLLDREAKATVRRSQRLGVGLAVESPKVLNNLRSGKLHGWARNYFANRCSVLCEENSVWYWTVNPAYTSVTCSHCGHLDKRSRNGLEFECVNCGVFENADVNAARNIAEKGTRSLEQVLSKRSGRVNG